MPRKERTLKWRELLKELFNSYENPLKKRKIKKFEQLHQKLVEYVKEKYAENAEAYLSKLRNKDKLTTILMYMMIDTPTIDKAETTEIVLPISGDKEFQQVLDNAIAVVDRVIELTYIKKLSNTEMEKIHKLMNAYGLTYPNFDKDILKLSKKDLKGLRMDMSKILMKLLSH